MPAAELHFYDADDPNGATIFECSTDDEFVKSIELDIQRDSLGSGKVTFARKVGVGLFTRQIVVPEVLVRVLVPSVHPTKYFYGFWINPRQQQVISKDEQGGEGFTFAGPGPKHYLERMILWSASFTGIDSAVDKEAGIWRWPETAVAGRILNRLLLEDQANPSGPFLPDLHASFDDTDDSDGNPWTEDVSDSDGSFILRISDDYLKLLWTIEDISGLTSQVYLGEVGDPVIRLDAFQSFGRDLTGPIGASTVHFTEGVNISTDLDVEGSSYRKASHALVRGNDGVYNLAFKPSWSPGDLKKVVGTAYDSSSGAVLDRAGERFLTRQDDGEDQIDLRIVTGFDPESGLYMPGPDYIGGLGHFWVGDSISLTTGQDQQTALDYDDDTEVVTGIELELEEAVRDDTDEQAARSFAVTVKLNEQRKSNHTARDLAGNRGTTPAPPNVLQLCQPSTFTDPEPAAFIGTLGAACSNSDTAVASDYSAWTGTDEERVEITSAEDVPAGGTILVAVSTNKDGSNAIRDRIVYDEKGNTYELDAESPASGTSDVIAQVWRSVLDTAIVTGDYIRFATQVAGVSFTGGRCIAASAWDGSLSSPTVGDSDEAFGSSPAVASSPISEVAFLAINTAATGTLTADTDWVNLDAYVSVTGAGTNKSSILSEYLQPGDGQGWTGSNTASTDWTVISVGYVSGGTEGGGSVRDGNADLVGTSSRAARCDHRHDVHRDTAPTVDDDYATAGYKLGTIWAQLDDLDAPTEIVAVWLMVDETEGAAVWLSWPAGTSVTLSDDIPIVESGTGSAGTSDEASRSDHVHPLSSSGSGIGEILISDTPSTPLVFADLVQNEAQDDLVYGDP